MIVSETLAHGNALAEIIAARDGTVRELRPHPWRSVTPMILPSGRLVYDAPESPAPAHAAKLKRLLDADVIHLRDRSDDGLIGRPRLARCAAPARVALTMQAYAEELYQNSARPSGVLSLAVETIQPEELERLRDQARQLYAGPRNAGNLMVLTGGSLTYSPIATSPEDMEMLAARRFSVEEIARIFQVPPPLIQDYSHNTFTNSHAAALWFAQHTLGPWVRKLEEALKRALFSAEERRDLSIEFDMSSLLRGDPAQRWASHEIAVRNGILTPDEIREVEGWNARAPAEAPPRPGLA
jgi:HK97 family phage portal protein